MSGDLITILYYREEKCKFKKLQKEVDKMASMMAGLGDDDDEEKSDDEDALEKENGKESSDDDDSESEEEGSGSDSDSDTSESEAEVNKFIFGIGFFLPDFKSLHILKQFPPTSTGCT